MFFKFINSIISRFDINLDNIEQYATHTTFELLLLINYLFNCFRVAICIYIKYVYFIFSARDRGLLESRSPRLLI